MELYNMEPGMFMALYEIAQERVSTEEGKKQVAGQQLEDEFEDAM